MMAKARSDTTAYSWNATIAPARILQSFGKKPGLIKATIKHDPINGIKQKKPPEGGFFQMLYQALVQ
jgi:hypothetical protein